MSESKKPRETRRRGRRSAYRTLGEASGAMLAIVLIALPAAAGAATLRVAGTQVKYKALPGESNNPGFNIRPSDAPGHTDVLWLTDNVSATLGPGCVDTSPGARCTVPTNPNPLAIYLGDGDDLSPSGGTNLAGGAGLPPATVRIFAGPGHDDRMLVDGIVGTRIRVVLDGGSGNDVLHLPPGRGHVLRGGPGIDEVGVGHVSIGSRIKVALDDRANDGAAGAKSNVMADIENIFPAFGGRSRLTLIGSSGRNRITGDTKDDVIKGKGGKDVLRGGAGIFNELTDGDDRLFGGKGRDSLKGGHSNDFLNGGPGVDSYRGDYDPQRGGNDRIKARDGKRERIRCGSGADVVQADRRDITRGCERVKRRR